MQDGYTLFSMHRLIFIFWVEIHFNCAQLAGTTWKNLSSKAQCPQNISTEQLQQANPPKQLHHCPGTCSDTLA